MVHTNFDVLWDCELKKTNKSCYDKILKLKQFGRLHAIGQTDKHTDIATIRLNWPWGQFKENFMRRKKLSDYEVFE